MPQNLCPGKRNSWSEILASYFHGKNKQLHKYGTRAKLHTVNTESHSFDTLHKFLEKQPLENTSSKSGKLIYLDFYSFLFPSYWVVVFFLNI
jgi:hypothetical protein